MAGIKQKTIDKFYLAMQDMQASNGFNGTEMASIHSISCGMTRVLIDMGHVKKIERGLYKWVGAQPTPHLARKVIELVNRKTNDYNRRKRQEPDAPVVTFDSTSQLPKFEPTFTTFATKSDTDTELQTVAYRWGIPLDKFAQFRREVETVFAV